MRFSDEHSSLVARVRNLSKNFMSPQLHVVFDDLFSSIRNDARIFGTKIRSIFNDFSETCKDYYREETKAPEGASAEPPSEQDHVDKAPELGNEWLS